MNEQPRILFYSHDSVGLGHLRRTLTLADALSDRFPRGSFLLASGSEASLRFQLPRGLEVVKLPSVGKGEQGEYVSRRLPGGLPALVQVRRALLLELVRSYQPHVLVVDNKVLGVAGELAPALECMREQGGKVVLGLRDIIDTPEAVAAEWKHADVRRALTELYDSVCVYGSAAVFDMRKEYPVPEELGRTLSYVGYVVRPSKGLGFPALPRLRQQLLITMGGGEDGADRVERCLDALELRTPAWDTVIVLGPLLDAARTRKIKRRARMLPHVQVHAFYEDMPRLFESSSAVVSMAGYNTVTELLRARLPVLFLPRTSPREEQLLRAERVQRLGLGEVLLDLDASRLREGMERVMGRARVDGWLPELDGARRFVDVIDGLLGNQHALETRIECDSRIS